MFETAQIIDCIRIVGGDYGGVWMSLMAVGGSGGEGVASEGEEGELFASEPDNHGRDI